MARPNEMLKGMAASLATDLGLPPPDFGELKNDGLEALVAELEAKKSAAPAPPAAALEPVVDAPKPPFNGDNDANGGGGPPPPVVSAPPVLPSGTVSVAPGLSIICRRGHLDAGTVVTAADFGRGEIDMTELVARGALVKS
jgi:hypothetical protein